MKTGVTLISQSRVLFGETIRQETKTGSLNLSDLEKAYQKARALYGWGEKGKVQDIISQKENSERVYYVLKETGIINSDFSEFMEMVEKQGMIKTLKELNCYHASGRSTNKTVWCNPYIWVLIAMELNPMLYGKTVVWLTDQLVFNRIEAGQMYKGLSKAVYKFPDVDFSALAKALNHIVFGRHETGIRNTGTESELRELERLEANLAFSIDSGFINSFPALMDHLRSLWHKKSAALTA
ncbi:hypothetical protein MUK70_12885 [Dyadobacter chenwenxiniae]|uniref:Uncharacterized protein n=1 Tax=Dyadobacter chenwenxiniae TaxID=2906456 RepID=A0A9X1PH50_9BACT|nr:hypothetical protein [Dyadobacter chenwenxiniae]MCF0060140.1 hypothetical protein [Dyadobacter chenwenxiniae]UON85877.1 hypothetical protein MUK70_12885 [Dyadobacter chenwenxiniae]